jgi:hypothetical protein
VARQQKPPHERDASRRHPVHGFYKAGGAGTEIAFLQAKDASRSRP